MAEVESHSMKYAGKLTSLNQKLSWVWSAQ